MRTNPLNFVFFSLTLLAASPVSFCQILPLQYYTSQDGLPANGINAFFQDSRGYLWIGTAEGVSVYDGATFTNYRTRDGLTRNFITCITESSVSPSTIWIGTAGGINIFSDGHFKSLHLDSTAASKEIQVLLEEHFLFCASPSQ